MALHIGSVDSNRTHMPQTSANRDPAWESWEQEIMCSLSGGKQEYELDSIMRCLIEGREPASWEQEHTSTMRRPVEEREAQSPEQELASTLSCLTEIYQNYIVRRNSFAWDSGYASQSENVKYTDDIGQIQYGTMMHLSTAHLFQWISSHNKRSFDQVLIEAALKRRQIKQIQSPDEQVGIERTGQARVEPYCTHLTDHYESLWKDEELRGQHEATLPYSKKKVLLDRICEIKGKSILVHTEVAVAERVMKEVALLYGEVSKKSYKDKEDLYEDLGKIFWWICRAKPWSLGDPSIAEIVIKAMAWTKGFPIVHPWKENLIPWCEVIKEKDPANFHLKDLLDHEVSTNPEAFSTELAKKIYKI